MNQVETNLIRSFRRLKSDIIDLQNSISDIDKLYDALMNEVMEFKLKQKPKTITRTKTVIKRVKSKPVVKTVRARPKAKVYVSSKESKKFHIPECPFAQNILPKQKVTYKSKTKALNEGLKPCSCVK